MTRPDDRVVKKCLKCLWWFRVGRDMGQCRMQPLELLAPTPNPLAEYKRTHWQTYGCKWWQPKEDERTVT